MPDLVDLADNVNMHGTFVASGPGIRKQSPVAGIRAIDVAPTIAFLMGIPGPQNARGKILFGLTTGAGRFKEVTLLQISDYHGQLVPLSEAADNLSGGVASNPSFAIGGAAFLKPWFDSYRAEAKEAVFTVAGGDPIGATRAGWRPSIVYNVEGFKLGLVGFSDADLTSLIFPGNLGPFAVTDPLVAVNAEAAKLRAKGVKAVVAIGHEGATAGTFDNPTGPLISLADGTQGVDAVLGDHTDFQTISYRPNGVLVAENRSKGIRFTRLRLVVDASTQSVVYKTADWHKPWDIGVTPNAAIQARIDDLNAQLAPILGTVIGSSSRAIPRTDACGNAAGRTCESLVGNVTTDAMRTKYAPSGVEFAITNAGGLRDALTCPPAVDGSCTGASVDLTAGSTYKIAENDFMANGGDFYPNFVSRMTTQDIMDEVLADYITANTPISPAIQGRTTCVDGNGATAPNCPVVTP